MSELLAELRELLLAELEAQRTLSDRMTDDIIRLRRGFNRMEQRIRATTQLLSAGDEDGGD